MNSRHNRKLPQVCQDFCVNGQVLFLGMGRRGRGQFPFLGIDLEAAPFSLRNSLQGRHPFRPQNRKVVQGFAPVMNRHGPLLGRLPQRQKQQLHRCLFVGESATDFDDLPKKAQAYLRFIER